MDPCSRNTRAAPIHWAVLNGETTTGASTFLLKHEIDTGHVLGKVEVPIGPNDTTGAVHDQLLEAGKHLLVATVNDLADGTAQPVPQSKLLAEGERLNEAQSCSRSMDALIGIAARAIHNQIRGLNPFPGAWTTLPDGSTLRIHSSAITAQDWEALPAMSMHPSRNLPFNVGT